MVGFVVGVVVAIGFVVALVAVGIEPTPPVFPALQATIPNRTRQQKRHRTIGRFKAFFNMIFLR